MTTQSPLQPLASRLEVYFDEGLRVRFLRHADLREAVSTSMALAVLDERIERSCAQIAAALSADLNRLLAGRSELRPELDRVQRGRVVSAGIFSTDPTLLPLDVASAAMLTDLEADCYAFYHRAHRLLKLMDLIPAFPKQSGHGVRIVRNQLIEHPGQGANNRARWSFGFDTVSGPRVRPVWFGSETPSHSDAGYRANRTELVKDLDRFLQAQGHGNLHFNSPRRLERGA